MLHDRIPEHRESSPEEVIGSRHHEYSMGVPIGPLEHIDERNLLVQLAVDDKCPLWHVAGVIRSAAFDDPRRHPGENNMGRGRCICEESHGDIGLHKGSEREAQESKREAVELAPEHVDDPSNIRSFTVPSDLLDHAQT